MSEYLNPDGLAFSSHYAETMEHTVFPFLEARQQDMRIPGVGERPLYCSQFKADHPRGTVVIVHGFTENAYKFSEIIYSLLQNGFDVAAYDQRGHGRSWRSEKIQDMSLTDVDRFTDYKRDLEIIMDTVVSKLPKPWLLFSHSMGGAVSALFLEEHPQVFSRAALCAPMIQANLGGLAPFAARMLCHGMELIGKSNSRIFVSKPYTQKEEFETSCATGKERFDWYEDIRFNRKEFQNNGPTYSWLLESVRVTSRVLAPGAPENIACPVRLYTAGLDNTVLPEPQKKFISRVKDGSHVVVDNAKHEIYRSADDVLFPWWHDVLEFLKGNIG